MSRMSGLILATVAVMLTSCAGFVPLYAEPGVVGRLERIAVQVPDSRTGYLLRERLDDAFGRDLGVPPAYRLVTRVRESRAALGRRADDTATRYELALTVSYDLRDAQTNARLYNNIVTVTTTYAASAQPYAGVVATQDATERAAAQAADEIRSDLAQVFADRGRAGAPGG